MPADHKRKLRDGEREVVVLGHKLVADFNDRKFLRAVLEMTADFQALQDDEGAIKAAGEVLRRIDALDEFFVDKFGQATRDKLFGKGREPVKEPIEALFQLANEAGPAYDAMFGAVPRPE